MRLEKMKKENKTKNKQTEEINMNISTEQIQQIIKVYGIRLSFVQKIKNYVDLGPDLLKPDAMVQHISSNSKVKKVFIQEYSDEMAVV